MAQEASDPALRPAGYLFLIERYELDVVPNWHRSFVAPGNLHRVDTIDGVEEEAYPARYWPGESVGDHLEFALKYDGTNLAILAAVFEAGDETDFLDFVQSKRTGKYARRIWFFYEFLTGNQLPLEDLRQGNYVDSLPVDDYYAIKPGRKIRRQRINDNLPGDMRFCPIIRRTAALRELEAANLPGRCREIVSRYPVDVLHRALSYLYTRETKSSFSIEHIRPSQTRTERFVAQLQLAERRDFCEKSALIDLQNRIVDPRFRDPDYRKTQNYVGETVSWQNERIHFIAPKPEDLPELMEGLVASHRKMEQGDVSPVVHAAAIAYGFVFLHPFEDGNGRIHRFLIHNILARRGFSPGKIIFPVSAAMLKDAVAYDRSLEFFSRPLLGLVEYELDEGGRMTAQGNSAKWYRYMDLTTQTEALFRFIQETIETELAGELAFLANYDRTKAAVQEIVDMPDRKIDLFIRLCIQGNGRLSTRKRESLFAFLSAEEVMEMEKAVRNSYMNQEPHEAE